PASRGRPRRGGPSPCWLTPGSDGSAPSRRTVTAIAPSSHGKWPVPAAWISSGQPGPASARTGSPIPHRAVDPVGGRPAALPVCGAVSALVEGADQRVGAVVKTKRVGIPDPDVHRDQERVPEGELGPGLRLRHRALGLARLGNEVAVRVMARGGEL